MQTTTHTIGSAAPYTWKTISRYVLAHKRPLIFANIVAILASLLIVPIPLLMPLLVDEVLLNKPGKLLTFLNSYFPTEWHGPVLYIGAITLVTVVLRIAGLFLMVLQTREFTLIAKDITYNIRKVLLAKVQSAAMAEYETLGSGTISSHFVVDIETIDNFLGVTISKFIVAVLSLIGIIMVLLWLHWQLALFIILLNPLVVYFTIKMGKFVKELKKKENKSFSDFQQALTETLDAIQQIRASNREKHFFQRLNLLARDVKEHSARFSWKSDAAGRFSFIIFLAGFDIFRAVSMLMVVFSGLSIGEMFAVFGYLWFMMQPVQEVLNIQYSWFSANAALTRINTLTQLHSEPDYPHQVNPFKGHHTVNVRAENITFAYGNKPPVLKNVNLTIPAGQKIALVGASGGGKSTFVQVLLGMYQPQQGMLYFNDEPINRIGLDVVRENVATVLQQPALFNDTIRMNLTLGQESSEDQLWQALRIAQLEETVKELEDGLDTVVGRQGVRLSGGQRQRLAIARMILSEPKVVILDEATSSLDTETERKLHHALNDFLQDRTTLIIAHRLSAVRQADHIFVFDDGHIIEQGKHEDLLENGGLYRQLYGE